MIYLPFVSKSLYSDFIVSSINILKEKLSYPPSLNLHEISLYLDTAIIQLIL